MNELTQKLYELLTAAEYSQVQLAAQIMRSGNHTREELISVIDKVFNDHNINRLYESIYFALSTSTTKRQLEKGYGLDFLLPVCQESQIHICILVRGHNKKYKLDRIEIRCGTLDCWIFCPPNKLCKNVLFIEQNINASVDLGQQEAVVFDVVQIVPVQEKPLVPYVKELTESFRSVCYDFILENILKGNLIA